MARHAACYRGHRPGAGRRGHRDHALGRADREGAGAPGKFFGERVFPVLTPLAVDPAHPFPYISGLSLNLAVVVRNPDSGREQFARVKVPPLLPRFLEASPAQRLRLARGGHRRPLGQLFPGMEVVEHHSFRVTRNEDLEVEEDDAENLLQALEKELLRRRFGPPVRLEVEEPSTRTCSSCWSASSSVTD